MLQVAFRYLGAWIWLGVRNWKVTLPFMLGAAFMWWLTGLALTSSSVEMLSWAGIPPTGFRLAMAIISGLMAAGVLSGPNPK